METAPKSDTVYLIHPRLGGLPSDTVIQIEKGEILYYVKARQSSGPGRQYGIYDKSNQELLRTDQDTSALLPQHNVFQNDKPIGRIGQSSIMPQRYFIQLTNIPRAALHVGSASPVFTLDGEDGTVIADIAQDRSTWIVIIPTIKDHFLLLSCLAILHRESTIAGG